MIARQARPGGDPGGAPKVEAMRIALSVLGGLIDAYGELICMIVKILWFMVAHSTGLSSYVSYPFIFFQALGWECLLPNMN